METFESAMERLAKAEETYKLRHEDAMRTLSPHGQEVWQSKLATIESATNAKEAWRAFTLFRGISEGHSKWEAFKKYVEFMPRLSEYECRQALRYLDNKYYHFFGWKDYDEDDSWNRTLKSPYAEEVASVYAMIWDRLDTWYCKKIETLWRKRAKSIRPGGLFRQDGASDLHYYSIAENWFLRYCPDRVDLIPKSVKLASDYLDELKAHLEPDSS